MIMKSLMCCMAAALLAGCTSYDFHVTEAPGVDRVVSSVPERLATENMTYHMQAKENRLVVQIFNETEEMVQLLGEQSFVVDTGGASHPLRSQAIAPHSFAKLILPTLRPRFERQGFGFGVGTTVSNSTPYAPYHAYAPYGRPYYDSGYFPYYPDPYYSNFSDDYSYNAAPVQYMDSYEDANNFYWDWDGQAPIRLSITYQFGGGRKATDDFTVEKRPRD